MYTTPFGAQKRRWLVYWMVHYLRVQMEVFQLQRLMEILRVKVANQEISINEE